MVKRKDLSPGKKGEISISQKHSDLKQKEIAKKLNILTQTVSATRKKLEMRRNIHRSRRGKCERKRKTTLRLDRKIKAMALMDGVACHASHLIELQCKTSFCLFFYIFY